MFGLSWSKSKLQSLAYQNFMENSRKQAYNYTVLLEKEQDGGYHAFCPILKGCHSQGDTVEEAIENITEAIELYLESLIADSQPIPKEDLIVKPLSVLV
jgi:predicted RNase H-like HicB family nuclease